MTEAEGVREVIEEAHHLLSLREYDRAMALLSSSINLYGRHLASILKASR